MDKFVRHLLILAIFLENHRKILTMMMYINKHFNINIDIKISYQKKKNLKIL